MYEINADPEEELLDRTEIQIDKFADFLLSPKIILGGFIIYFCYLMKFI
jgi:hypothetical protein